MHIHTTDPLKLQSAATRKMHCHCATLGGLPTRAQFLEGAFAPLKKCIGPISVGRLRLRRGQDQPFRKTRRDFCGLSYPLPLTLHKAEAGYELSVAAPDSAWQTYSGMYVLWL